MQRSELYKQTLLIEKYRLLILLMLIALNHIHYNTCKTATFVFKKKQKYHYPLSTEKFFQIYQRLQRDAQCARRKG